MKLTKNVRKIVKETFNYKCGLCENSNSLHIHHVDGNRKNNEIDNLWLLCYECHAFMHPDKAIKILLWQEERGIRVY